MINKRLEALKKQLEEIKKQIEELEKTKKELERQLAEKEKAHMEAMENALNDFLTLRQELNQAKTDFAIEQLGKVKKFVVRQLFVVTKDCSDLDEAEATGCNELREDILKEIDNQIQELKKVKNEK